MLTIVVDGITTADKKRSSMGYHLKIASILCIFAVIHPALMAMQFVSIGTGSNSGLYYPLGKAIGRLINKKTKQHKIKVLVSTSSGSVSNINGLLKGKFQIAFAQSDRQYEAVNGLHEWSEMGPQHSLRTLLSLHGESIVLIASVSSEVKKVKDLLGKKVNIGNLGSGQLQNSKDILSAFDVPTDQIQVKLYNAIDTLKMYKNGKIEAFFYTIGHPNKYILDATSARIKARIIPIAGPEVDLLLTSKKYYSKTVIPVKKYYPNLLNKKNVESVGVKATIVVSSELSDKIAYLITKEVYENLLFLSKTVPVLAQVKKSDMLKGLSAPLHHGAMRYYKEKLL
ncbi:MAG: TAXI family TRAP transporter solute-binding subunit [Proteobacteria bacterium]|nr:TAXI family TRAP transporter solute-binding subunit [Pseudomonadota bacterium]